MRLQEKRLVKVENPKRAILAGKEKRKGKIKRFKVKTRKGSLNHIKKRERKKKMRGQVENPKRAA